MKFTKNGESPKERFVRNHQKLGLIAICENIDSCIELSNKFAPEHLEIITLEPKSFKEILWSNFSSGRDSEGW